MYTGVKVKVEEVTPGREEEKVTLELSSMCQLSDDENNEMKRIQHVLSKRLISPLVLSKEMTEFLAIPGARRHKLTMYIDVFFLSHPHISQLELIGTGIQSALLSTTISEIEVSYNEVTDEELTELTKTTKSLKGLSFPELSVVGVVYSQKV
jgi:hypothetical protein